MQTPSPAPWLHFSCNERFGDHVACHDIALLQPWTCIFGPSGSGKSTLLRLLAGLLPQRTGTCQVHGRELRRVPAHHRRIALVEQLPALFPHLDVERNVAFGCRTTPQNRQAVETLLEDFRLLPLRRAAVHTLSGGERQRVAIARALCSQPRVLLLDEVFTGMDAALRTDLIAVLQRYRERMQIAVLGVTHNVGEAFSTANEILRMQHGQITAQGPPAQVLRDERQHLLAQLSEHSV